MNTYMPNVGTAFLWSDTAGTIYLAVHFGAATKNYYLRVALFILLGSRQIAMMAE